MYTFANVMQETNENICPLISFIITDYNLPVPLLRECIESILSLDLSDEEREIIVVDDGSETSPKDLLGDLALHLIYIYKENGGLSSARNLAIEKATGEYLQFVDGDDCLIPENYNLIIKKVRSQEFNLVHFAHTRSLDATNTLSKRANLFIGTYGNYYLKHHNLKAAAWSYVFRKSILGNLRFTEGIFHEDEEFTPMLFLNCGIMVYTSIPAYYYRVREGSIITSNDREHINKRFNDYVGILLRLRNVASKSDYNAVLHRRINQMVMDLLYNTMTTFNAREHLEKDVALLSKYSLFPLPLRFYTWKYLLFSILSRFKTGRNIIFNKLT